MATTIQKSPRLSGVKSKKVSNPIHDKGVQEFVRKVPSIYRDNYIKAMSGASRAAAIKAKCLDCCCWQRKEVQLCTSTACPLHPYRPYQKE